jgi:hypothetical protein
MPDWEIPNLITQGEKFKMSKVYFFTIYQMHDKYIILIQNLDVKHIFSVLNKNYEIR